MKLEGDSTRSLRGAQPLKESGEQSALLKRDDTDDDSDDRDRGDPLRPHLVVTLIQAVPRTLRNAFPYGTVHIESW